MWRELVEAARHRGRRASREVEARVEPASSNGEAKQVSSTAEGGARVVDETVDGGAAPTAVESDDVPRETWDGAATETWDDPAGLDTPIGAEAQRAVRVMHGAQGHLPPPPR